MRFKKLKISVLSLALLLFLNVPITGYQTAHAMAFAPAVTALEYVIHALFSSVGFGVKSADDTRALSHDFVQWVEGTIESNKDIPSDQEIVIAALYACYKYQFDNVKNWLGKVQAGAMDLYHDAISLPKDVVDVFNAYVADRTGRYTPNGLVDSIDVIYPIDTTNHMYTIDKPYRLLYSFNSDYYGCMISVDVTAYGTGPMYNVIYSSRSHGKTYYSFLLMSREPFTICRGSEEPYEVSKSTLYGRDFYYDSPTKRFHTYEELPALSYMWEVSDPFQGEDKIRSVDILYSDIINQAVGIPEVVNGNVVEVPLTDREWTVIEGGQGSNPNPDDDPIFPYVPLVGIGGQQELTEEGLQSWINEQNKEINNEGIDDYINKIFPSPEKNPDVYPSENPDPGTKPDPEPGTDPDPEPSGILETLNSIKTEITSIPDKITSFFTIDTAVISASFSDLLDTFQGRFSGLNQLASVFSYNGQTFSETPPIFKMKTPDALKFDGVGDEIVVLDLTPFATQLHWCRLLLIAMLWVLFAHWLLNQFDTKFHVG